MTAEQSKKILIVTGATSGIGAAIVERQIEAGFNVIGMGRKNRIENGRPEYRFVEVDFSKSEETEHRIVELVKSINSDQLAGLVCCAGVGRFGGIEEFSLSQMRYIMDVNFLAHAILVKHCLPKLRQANNGVIIGIGSESALA